MNHIAVALCIVMFVAGFVTAVFVVRLAPSQEVSPTTEPVAPSTPPPSSPRLVLPPQVVGDKPLQEGHIASLFTAIRKAETGGHPDPANAKGDYDKQNKPTSHGYYQISRAYYLDALYLDGMDESALDYAQEAQKYPAITQDLIKSQEIMCKYWRRYCPIEYNAACAWDTPPEQRMEAFEILSRVHNGGPSIPRLMAVTATNYLTDKERARLRNTADYWEKVKKHLTPEVGEYDHLYAPEYDE